MGTDALTARAILRPMDVEELERGHKKKLFLWGTVFTWTLSIPLIIGVSNGFKGISEQKATGLGAVLGALAEAYATFGLILAFVLPVVAIVLLVRVVFERTSDPCCIFGALHLLVCVHVRTGWPIRVAVFQTITW